MILNYIYAPSKLCQFYRNLWSIYQIINGITNGIMVYYMIIGYLMFTVIKITNWING